MRFAMRGTNEVEIDLQFRVRPQRAGAARNAKCRSDQTPLDRHLIIWAWAAAVLDVATVRIPSQYRASSWTPKRDCA